MPERSADSRGQQRGHLCMMGNGIISPASLALIGRRGGGQLYCAVIGWLLAAGGWW